MVKYIDRLSVKAVWLVAIGLIGLSVSAWAQTPSTNYPCDYRNYPGQQCPGGDCDPIPTRPETGCNCFDGIDNDGDGKIDMADPDCFPYLGQLFVGSGSECSVTPPGALTPFDLVGPPVTSSQNTADTQSKVAAGDVDGNGIPDALITSKWNAEVRLISTAAQAGLPSLNNNQPINFAEGDIIADFRLSSNAIVTLFDNALKAGTGDNSLKTKNLLLEHEVLIADINRDGKAEVFGVVSDRQSNPTSPPNYFFLIGLELNQYGAQGLQLMPGYPTYLGTNRPGTFGIADMDGDGRAELYLRDRIFAAETGRLLASEGGKNMTNTALWDVNVSSAPVAIDIRTAGADGFVMELVVGSQIYKIPNISANRSPATPAALILWRDMNSLAFDINNDGVPDQYFVKLMNDPDEYGIDTHSSTSVADIDKDGFVDVIVTGALNSSSGRTTVFYWNVQANSVTGIMTPTSAELGLPNGPGPAAQKLYNNYLNGWIWGTGRVNIGDANTDGHLDLLFIAGNQLFCYTANSTASTLTLLWERTINDSRSGVLTVTIYDFNNDGFTEVVYRDALELVIIDGLTGQNKLWSRICQSHTYTEGPIIADVNGDGNTDICVACNFSDNTNQFNIEAGIQQQALGHIRMYFSSGEWLPTRQVWNQPGYFVVNINDDLTLPFPQLDIAVRFVGNCGVGPPGERMPFNVFLNQVPFLSGTGCPIYPAPDLTFIGDDPNDPNVDPDDPNYFPKVFVDPNICGNVDLRVGFNITNSGEIPISTTIPVSFYIGSPYDPNNPLLTDGDPNTTPLLHSANIVINNLRVGDTLSIGDLLDSEGNLIRQGDQPFIAFDGPGTTFLLYVVLYDDGTQIPIDTTTNQNQNGQTQGGPECDITNNFWPILVTPKPFTVNIDSIPNVRCEAGSPNNGVLISHISVGPDTVIDLSPYTFQWYLADQVTPAGTLGIVDTNYNLTDLDEGDYYLVITNVEKGCSSDPILGQVTNGDLIIPGLTITKLDQTTCEPPNGALQADVVGGNAGFEFRWEDAGGPIGTTGPLLENVKRGNYFVTVIEEASGCFMIASEFVDGILQIPEVQAFAVDVVNCLDASSGVVTATAFLEVDGQLVPQDSNEYRFDWYFYDYDPITDTYIRGSLLPGSNGNPTIKGVDVGFYEVTITNLATGCTESNLGADTTEVKDMTFLPEILFTELAKQTSCDPLQPNGRLMATALRDGVPDPDQSQYTFEWFEGQNTITPHTDVSGIDGQIAESVKGGGQAYTVRITTANDCSVTRDTIVTERIVFPEVSLVTTPNSVCDESLGFTGSVLSTVTFDGVDVFAGNPDYLFEWYNGPMATGTPTNLDQQNYVNLDSGFYTLVVTNTLLHCPSVATVEQVLSIKALPVITSQANPSTNCLPLVPGNGNVEVTDVDGAGLTSDYTFSWHRGIDPSGQLIANTAVSPDTLQGRSPNNFFTVLVTNISTGCENTSTVEVVDASVIPMVVLTPFPNTICDPALTNPPVDYDGMVESIITNQGTNPISDYEFTWVDEEDGSVVLQTIGSPGLNLTDRDTSYYTLVVRQVSTGCVSNPATAEVTPQIVLPLITADANPSTNCDPALANGGVQVTDVDNAGVGVPYVFEWYRGLETGIPANLVASAAASPDTLQGATGKFYTVLVTNQSDGCQNTRTVELPDARILPIVTLAPFPNNICDASLTLPPVQYNGRVESTITNQGTFPIDDYQFTWTDEEGPGTQVLQAIGAAGQNLLNRDSSYYTLVVVQLSTGCVSDPVTAEVTPDLELPAITADANASTNCDPLLANGGVQVTDVDGAGTGSPYVFQWRRGIDLSGYVVAATAASPDTLQGATGRFYTVLVTNQSDGCQNTRAIEVPDDRSLPVITLASTDNTICVGTPDGTASLNSVTYKGATLTAPDPFTGYSFSWDSGETTETIIEKAAAFYELVVTRDDVGCSSDPVITEVRDDFVYPVIALESIPQTSCDSDNLNGRIDATVDLGGGSFVTNGFTFAWFNGNNLTNPLDAANIDLPASAFRLPGNLFYTVQVTNNVTQCDNTRSVFLQEIISIPRIELVATPIVDCRTPGFVTATIFADLDGDGVEEPVPLADYDDYKFTWYNGNNTSAPELVSTTGRLLDSLDNGETLPAAYYTARVENILTTCASSDVTDLLNGPGPLFDVNIQINSPLPASCAQGTGVMTAYIDDGGSGTVTGFIFEWYNGSITNDIQNPPPSFYTNPPVSFKGLPRDVDSLAFYGDTYPAPGPAVPGYQPPDVTPGPSFTGPTLYGIPSGTYTVVATRDSDGCKEYLTTFLPFQSEPIIILAEIKPDDCSGDIGEISVDITVSGGSTAGDYKIWLINGANPTLSPPNEPSPFHSVISPATDTGNDFVGLASGIYTVVAQENPAIIPTGCFSAPVLIEMREALPPILNLLGSSFNTTCGAVLGDGSLEIIFDSDPSDPFNPAFPPPPPPVVYNPDPQLYDVVVLDGGGATVFSNTGYVGGTNLVIPNLVNDDFEVTITSSQGCDITKTFTVPWNPSVSEIGGDFDKTDAFYCDPTLEDSARIEVRSLALIGGAPEDFSDYRFDWFTDIGLSDNILSEIGDPTPVEGGEVLSNTAPSPPASPVTVGSYWVVATKLTDVSGSGGVGCFTAPLKVDILDKSADPAFTMEPFSNTACDVNFEGSLQIFVTDPGSVAASLGYGYRWLETPAGSPIADSSPNDGDGDGTDGDGDNPLNLSDGVYRLEVVNNNTGCFFPGQTTILKTTTPIIVASATKIDQIICDPGGSITVVEVIVGDEVDPDHDNFDFTWYRSDPNSTPIIDEENGVDVLDVISYADVGAGTYYVKAKRIAGVPLGSGCESAPLRMDIMDLSRDPAFSMTPFSNTACDTNFEGSLQVFVTDAGSVDATLGYAYRWLQTPVDSPIGDTDPNNGDGDGADGDGDNPQNLSDGVYRLEIKNNDSGCLATGQTTILKTTTPIIITNAITVDQIICDPGGSATVTEVIVGTMVDTDHDNFDFTWFANDPTPPPIIDEVNGEDVLDVVSYASVGAGTYYVKAKRVAGLPLGSGCESAPFRVDILDRSRDPAFTLTPFTNTACDMNFEGSLKIDVTDPGSVPATLGYAYRWLETPAASPIADSDPNNGDGDGSDGDGDNPLNLSDGVYRLEVKNNDSGCLATGQTTIQKTTVPIIVTQATVVDQFICAPDGSITVIEVTVGGAVDPDHGNFDFSWYVDDPNTVPIIDEVNDEDVLDENNYPSIGGGTYYVKAKRAAGVPLGSGCESAPFRVNIQDLHVNPIPTLHAFANSSCTDAFLNGAIRIMAKDNSGPGVNQLYDYEYIYDDFTNPPEPTVFVLGNNGNGINDGDLDSLMNLADGRYNFIIRNQVTQCETPAQIVIQYDPIASKPNIISVEKNFPFDCNGNGGDATVTAIRIGNGPPITSSPELDPPNFHYDWYDNVADAFAEPPVIPGNVPNGAPTDQRFVDMLRAGTYYVTVRDLLTDCKSTPTQVVIDSADIVFPHVVIQQTVLQLSCDPDNGTAELQATADGFTDANANYMFTWFNSLDGTGTTVIDPWPGSQSTITDLTDGNYSVTVLDNTTACTTTKLYIIPPFDPKFFPNIAVAGDPQSSCLVPNGSVVVRVIPFPTVNGLSYDPPYNFTVDLYLGDQSGSGIDQEPPLVAPDLANLPPLSANPPSKENPGSFIADPLDDGIYTVRLIDNNTGCIVVKTTEVIDDRRNPMPVIAIDNPLTNCDTRFNGQLSVKIDCSPSGCRPISHYDLAWWSETDPNDTLSVIDKLIGQDQGRYFVGVVNKASGCETILSEVIPVDQVLPPPPSIVLMQPQTICWEPDPKGNYPINEVSYPGNPLARPNGWLRAHVNNETVGYRFEWFTGQLSNDQVAGMTPDTTGIHYLHLPADTYTVKVVSLATGCSNVTSLPVPDQRLIPNGRVDTTPSFCEDARPPSGSVTLQQTNDLAVAFREIRWYEEASNAYIGDGSQVFNLPPGFYRAEFLTNEFCYNEAIGQIFTEILAYNLVSSNADGANDTWVIDCISRFTVAAGAPRDNNVKIFNRHGVLVYEADGYNNDDKVFRGIGENGIYTMGTELPDGTYFFIIDKRDGSKPLTGFLELVR